jgi:hypothetical protein
MAGQREDGPITVLAIVVAVALLGSVGWALVFGL